MEALQNRIDSFSKSKRVKRSSKSSKATTKWPHPTSFKANPEALAEAGFYFNPSAADKDNVVCFECGKQLSEWEEDDDPFDLHWVKCGNRCSWAAVRCGLRGDMDRHGRFTFPDKMRLPGSERMEKARLGTFSVGDGWVHDQTKNHGANSRKMAQAGFVWTPQLPGDDLATCLYCNISLSGWEKDDDPMDEHRKRVKAGTICPFFAHTSTSGISPTLSTNSMTSSTTGPPTTNNPARSTSTKPPSRVQSKPASRSKSSRLTRANKEIAQHVPDISEEGDNDIRGEAGDDASDSVPTVRLVQKPTAAKRTRKSSRAPSARPSTRTTTRSASQLTDSQRPGTRYHGNNLGKSTTLRNVEEVSDELAERQNKYVSEIEEQTRAPSRSRTSRKPSKMRGKAPRKKQQEAITGEDEEISDELVARRHVSEAEEECFEPPRSRASHKPPSARGGKVSRKKYATEEETSDEIAERPQRDVSEAEEQSLARSRSRAPHKPPKARGRKISQKRQQAIATEEDEETSDELAAKQHVSQDEEHLTPPRPRASKKPPNARAGKVARKEHATEDEERSDEAAERPQWHVSEEQSSYKPSKARGKKVSQKEPAMDEAEASDDVAEKREQQVPEDEQETPSQSRISQKQSKTRGKVAVDAVEEIPDRPELQFSEEEDRVSHLHASQKRSKTWGKVAVDVVGDISDRPEPPFSGEEDRVSHSHASLKQSKTQGKVAVDAVEEIPDRPERLFSGEEDRVPHSHASQKQSKTRGKVAVDAVEEIPDRPELLFSGEEDRVSHSHASQKRSKTRGKVAVDAVEEIPDRPELLFSGEEDLSHSHASQKRSKTRGKVAVDAFEEIPNRAELLFSGEEDRVSHSHAQKRSKTRGKVTVDAVEEIPNRPELLFSEEEDRISRSHASHNPTKARGINVSQKKHATEEETADEIAEGSHRHASRVEEKRASQKEDEGHFMSSSSRAAHKPLDISQKKQDDKVTERPMHRISDKTVRQSSTHEETITIKAAQKDMEGVGSRTESTPAQVDDDMASDVPTADAEAPSVQREVIQKKSLPSAGLVSLNFDTTPAAKEPEASTWARPPPPQTEPAPASPSAPTAMTNAKTPEPQVLPALSRIPYMPLQTLTDAELDMTVEEWTRYQIEIEYDKLKRDGERELARFKARAEEVRRVIEGL